MPDDRIYDKAVPARERLLNNLRQMLAPIGLDQDAQNSWGNLFQTFISPTAPAEMRATYPLLNEQAGRRVQAWLAVLVEEGALAPGDNTDRARFLLTVVNGLAVQRALPADLPVLQVEAAVLATTIDALPFRE